MSEKSATLPQANPAPIRNRIILSQPPRSGGHGLWKTGQLIAHTIMDGLEPPEGGCVCLITSMPVDYNYNWPEAVQTAGPDTSLTDDVYKVAELYRPESIEKAVNYFVLLNLPAGDDNWDKALIWSQEQKAILKPTVPQDVFTISKRCPALNRKLEQGHLSLVATTDCWFDDERQTCAVLWLDSKRLTTLACTNSFRDANNWFAFRQE